MKCRCGAQDRSEHRPHHVDCPCYQHIVYQDGADFYCTVMGLVFTATRKVRDFDVTEATMAKCEFVAWANKSGFRYRWEKV
jgi:hypothetical protein